MLRFIRGKRCSRYEVRAGAVSFSNSADTHFSGFSTVGSNQNALQTAHVCCTMTVVFGFSVRITGMHLSLPFRWPQPGHLEFGSISVL
jgi:hypothetical protein